MDKELDDLLCQTFPNLYRERSMSMRDSCMGRGFECGRGWFLIIWNLSRKLEAMIVSLPEESRTDVRASQVKQKFAILRYVVDGSTKDMWDLIHASEVESSVVCEDCGQPGSRRGTGYISTLCASCWEVEQKRRLDRFKPAEPSAEEVLEQAKKEPLT